MSAKSKLAVLLSGGGTTLQNLIDHCHDGRLPADIVQVISNRPGAYGLERARLAGIATTVIERREQPSLEAFGERIFEVVRQSGADLVCLAGFMHYLPIPPDYAWRVLNIHPSLLPSFGGQGMYGHHVHDAVLAFGAKVSGCTVHFADEHYDHGPIIEQRSCPVQSNDTVERLAQRVFVEECIAYPHAILRILRGHWRLEGRRFVDEE